LGYHHTQYAPLIVAIMVGAGLFCLIGAYFSRLKAVRWSIAPIGLLVMALAALFSSLTVDVGEAGIAWYFGPGLWKYNIPRADIKSVAVVRNQWANGFGIRVAPGFRLYNVEGLDAVELRLKDGTVTRIGTDDAPALAQALK
jgi:hypothetical protein